MGTQAIPSFDEFLKGQDSIPTFDEFVKSQSAAPSAPSAPADLWKGTALPAYAPPTSQDIGTPPSVEETLAPPKPSPLNLPITQQPPKPQAASSIGPLPPVTGATDYNPSDKNPAPPQAPPVSVPTSMTPQFAPPNAAGPAQQPPIPGYGPVPGVPNPVDASTISPGGRVQMPQDRNAAPPPEPPIRPESAVALPPAAPDVDAALRDPQFKQLMQSTWDGFADQIPSGQTPSEKVQNAIARTALGMISPKSLAIMLGAEGATAALSAMVNSARGVALISRLGGNLQYLRQAIDITAQNAVPAAFAIKAGVAGTQAARDYIKTGDPEKAVEAAANVILGAAGALGISRGAASMADIHPPAPEVPTGPRAYEGAPAMPTQETRAQAPAMAAQLQEQGQGLAAQSWREIAESGKAMQQPITFRAGDRTITISPAGNLKGRQNFQVTDETGKQLTGGTGDAVETWIQHNLGPVKPHPESGTRTEIGPNGTVRTAPALMENVEAGTPGAVAGEPPSPISSVFRDQDAQYQQAVEFAQKTPSFGNRYLSKELGVKSSEAEAILSRLVADNIVVRTQNAKNGVVYHPAPQAALSPVAAESPAPTQESAAPTVAAPEAGERDLNAVMGGQDNATVDIGGERFTIGRTSTPKKDGGTRTSYTVKDAEGNLLAEAGVREKSVADWLEKSFAAHPAITPVNTQEAEKPITPAETVSQPEHQTEQQEAQPEVPPPAEESASVAQPQPRAYDSIQRDIDAEEAQLEAQGHNPTRMYAPGQGGVLADAPGWSEMPARLATLYTERDAAQAREDTGLDSGISERLEKAIPDSASREKFVKKLTQTDLPVAIRGGGPLDREKWRDIGRLSNEAVKFAIDESGEDAYADVHEVLGGTPEQPTIGLKLHKVPPGHARPSKAVFDRAQTLLDAALGRRVAEIPRGDFEAVPQAQIANAEAEQLGAPPAVDETTEAAPPVDTAAPQSTVKEASEPPEPSVGGPESPRSGVGERVSETGPAGAGTSSDLAEPPAATGAATSGERGTPAGSAESVEARPGVEGQPGQSETATGRSGGTLPGSEPAVRGGRERTGVDHSSDHRITEADQIGHGGAKTKAQQNLRAIKLLKDIESDGRTATPEEQRELVKYVGWGGISQAFNVYDRDWAPVARELRDALTDEEYNAARASTPNAHYTSPMVVAGMWRAMDHLGLGKIGNIRVIEPSMGVGHFFGLMPKDVLDNARLYGVELDSITGRIAKQLYPSAGIQVTGFEKVSSPKGFFDAAISNVPFGDYGISDPKYRKAPTRRSIHDYFFGKAVDIVRPGGIIAFITSSYTMDKVDSTVRKYLAERADLLGAIRLPNTTFKGNAGTEVTTDIIFLRPRAADAVPTGESWDKTEDIAAKDSTSKVRVNEYFARHPEMMLGQMALTGSMYGANQPTLEGDVTPEKLDAAIAHLPKDAIQPRGEAETKAPETALVEEGSRARDGSYVIKDGKLMQREGPSYVEPALTKDEQQRIAGIIPIREGARAVLDAQLSGDDPAWAKAKGELNRAYDFYVKKNGFLSADKNAKAFSDDPDSPLVLALEDWDKKAKTATKSDIFSKRTIHRYVPPESAGTATEALSISLAEHNRINWPRMSQLTGKSAMELQEELAGRVYLDPDGSKWVTADEYLSGNVREKLRQAEQLATADETFKGNVDALRAVQPEDLKASEVSARLGSPWIPANHVAEFIARALRAPVHRVSVGYAKPIALWRITELPSQYKNSAENTTKWGTKRVPAHELIELALNGQTPTVYDKVDDKTRVVNQAETLAAREKQDALKTKFSEWVWDGGDREKELLGIYNEEFNNQRLRQYDGSHLTFNGINSEPLRGGDLDKHQKNAVWRILQSGNTLLAHAVGAGKTWEMTVAIMEMRRLGLAHKPMMVVKNNTIEQIPREFARLYPSARLLVLGEGQLSGKNRRRTMARIATGNFDAVIVPHSSFGLLPVSDDTFNAFLNAQIQELVDAIEDLAKEEGKKGRTVKQLEKAKKRLEAKLRDKAKTESKDQGVTFEDLGVDALFVDEAHAYKNLFFVTKRTRVAGLPTSESDRAMDMFIKANYINEKTGYRGLVFATGTPISNTIAELYTMQRYMQLPTLRAHGIAHFDAWASNFAESVTGFELDVAGGGYRQNTRFSEFTNLPELQNLFRSFADVQTSEMLNLPRPALATGKVQSVESPASDELKELQKELGTRAQRIRSGGVDPRDDNMLKITGEGRKAALDLRLIDPTMPDRPDSKLNLLVDKVYANWKRDAADRLTQIVFIDMSTPDPKEFNAYDDVRNKLVKRGIPKAEIAFVHEAKSKKALQALFDKVNEGDVRIIMGSTEKMGAGTNVQRRLKSLHHVDPPWRPSDVEQREGRILRQGNKNKEVEVFSHVSSGSFDGYMWQTILNKARSIEGLMRGDTGVRRIEDVGTITLTAAEMTAIGSGNPLVREKTVVDAEVRKLATLKSAHIGEQRRIKREIGELEAHNDSLVKQIAHIEQDLKTRDAAPKVLKLGKREFTGETARKDGAEALETNLASWKGAATPQQVGTYAGFPLWTVPRGVDRIPDLSLRGAHSYPVSAGETGTGTIQSMEYAVRNMETTLDNYRNTLSRNKENLAEYQNLLGKGFDLDERLKAAVIRQMELEKELDLNKSENQAGATDEGNEEVASEPEEGEPSFRNLMSDEGGWIDYGQLFKPFLPSPKQPEPRATKRQMKKARKLAREIDLPEAGLQSLVKKNFGVDVERMNQKQAIDLFAKLGEKLPSEVFVHEPGSSGFFDKALWSPSFVLPRSRAGNVIWRAAGREYWRQKEMDERFSKNYQKAVRGLTEADKERVKLYRYVKQVIAADDGDVKRAESLLNAAGEDPDAVDTLDKDFLTPEQKAANDKLTKFVFNPIWQMAVKEGLVPEDRYIDDYLTFYRDDLNKSATAHDRRDRAAILSAESGMSLKVADAILAIANAKKVTFGPFDFKRGKFSLPGTLPLDDIASIYIRGFGRKSAQTAFLRVANRMRSKIKNPYLRQYAQMYINQYAGIPVRSGFDEWIAKKIHQNGLAKATLGRADVSMDRVAIAATSLQYLTKIGLNLFTPIQNLTQTGNTAAMAGAVPTARGFYKYTAARMGPWASMAWKKDLARLRKSGVLDSLSNKIERPQSRGWTGKLGRAATFLFDQTEQMNRGVAFFAGYLNAIKDGKSETEAIEGGRDLVRRTQFFSGRLDAPLLSRTPVGRVAYQFKVFGLKSLEMFNEMSNAQRLKWLFYSVAMGGVAAAGVSAFLHEFMPDSPYTDMVDGWDETWNLAAFLGMPRLGKGVGIWQFSGLEEATSPADKWWEQVGKWFAGPSINAVVDTMRDAIKLGGAREGDVNERAWKLTWTLMRSWVPGGVELRRLAQALKEGDNTEDQLRMIFAAYQADKPQDLGVIQDISRKLGVEKIPDILPESVEVK